MSKRAMSQATQTHWQQLLLSSACLVFFGGWLLAWQPQQRLALQAHPSPTRSWMDHSAYR
ncbi:hypothetical protein BC831DRAFT_441156 [Entophlyctis helioformis]|nr:hypothetical protein BC831DRAFT_441156 [Entophlyctis helioformis]